MDKQTTPTNASKNTTESIGVMAAFLHRQAALIMGAVGFVMAVVGVLGSVSLLLVTVRLSRRQKNNHTLFISNLALTDLITMGYTWTFVCLDLTLGYNPMVNRSHCEFNRVISLLVFEVNLASLFCLSLNRYIRVCHASQYQKYFSTRRALLLVALLWVFGFAVSALPAALDPQVTEVDVSDLRNCTITITSSHHRVIIICIHAVLVSETMVVIGYWNCSIYRFWKNINGIMIRKYYEDINSRLKDSSSEPPAAGSRLLQQDMKSSGSTGKWTQRYCCGFVAWHSLLRRKQGAGTFQTDPSAQFTRQRVSENNLHTIEEHSVESNNSGSLDSPPESSVDPLFDLKKASAFGRGQTCKEGGSNISLASFTISPRRMSTELMLTMSNSAVGIKDTVCPSCPMSTLTVERLLASQLNTSRFVKSSSAGIKLSERSEESSGCVSFQLSENGTKVHTADSFQLSEYNSNLSPADSLKLSRSIRSSLEYSFKLSESNFKVYPDDSFKLSKTSNESSPAVRNVSVSSKTSSPIDRKLSLSGKRSYPVDENVSINRKQSSPTDRNIFVSSKRSSSIERKLSLSRKRSYPIERNVSVSCKQSSPTNRKMSVYSKTSSQTSRKSTARNKSSRSRDTLSLNSFLRKSSIEQHKDPAKSKPTKTVVRSSLGVQKKTPGSSKTPHTDSETSVKEREESIAIISPIIKRSYQTTELQSLGADTCNFGSSDNGEGKTPSAFFGEKNISSLPVATNSLMSSRSAAERESSANTRSANALATKTGSGEQQTTAKLEIEKESSVDFPSWSQQTSYRAPSILRPTISQSPEMPRGSSESKWARGKQSLSSQALPTINSPGTGSPETRQSSNTAPTLSDPATAASTISRAEAGGSPSTSSPTASANVIQSPTRRTSTTGMQFPGTHIFHSPSAPPAVQVDACICQSQSSPLLLLSDTYVIQSLSVPPMAQSDTRTVQSLSVSPMDQSTHTTKSLPVPFMDQSDTRAVQSLSVSPMDQCTHTTKSLITPQMDHSDTRETQSLCVPSMVHSGTRTAKPAVQSDTRAVQSLSVSPMDQCTHTTKSLITPQMDHSDTRETQSLCVPSMVHSGTRTAKPAVQSDTRAVQSLSVSPMDQSTHTTKSLITPPMDHSDTRETQSLCVPSMVHSGTRTAKPAVQSDTDVGRSSYAPPTGLSATCAAQSSFAAPMVQSHTLADHPPPEPPMVQSDAPTVQTPSASPMVRTDTACQLPFQPQDVQSDTYTVPSLSAPRVVRPDPLRQNQSARKITQAGQSSFEPTTSPAKTTPLSAEGRKPAQPASSYLGRRGVLRSFRQLEPSSSASYDDSTLRYSRRFRRLSFSFRSSDDLSKASSLRRDRLRRMSYRQEIVRISIVSACLVAYISYVPFLASVISSPFVALSPLLHKGVLFLLYFSNAVNWVVYGVLNPTLRTNYAEIFQKMHFCSSRHERLARRRG